MQGPLASSGYPPLQYYHESRAHLSLDRGSPIPRPMCPPEQGKMVAKAYLGGLHHCYTRGIAVLHQSCPAWSAEEACAISGILPSPRITGIPNHSDDASIMAAGSVKPARPFLLARMTFSIGTPQEKVHFLRYYALSDSAVRGSISARICREQGKGGSVEGFVGVGSLPGTPLNLPQLIGERSQRVLAARERT